MFKKAIAIAIVVASASNSFAAITSKEGDSFLTTVEKTAFEAVYFGVTPLMYPIAYIVELKDRFQAKQLIKDSQDDAQFFAEHVKHSEKGYMSSQLYNKMTIVLREGEVMTADVRMNELSSETTEVVVANAPGVYDAEQIKGSGLKINGRKLITEQLYKAHLAAQYLIYSDVLAIPQDIKSESGSEAKAATSGSALNKIIIRSNNGSL